jgi:hypothetical protein
MIETRSSGDGNFYAAGTQYDLDDALAAGFIHNRWATFVRGGENEINENRETTTLDNGKTRVNTSANNFTITLAANTIANDLLLIQKSTGTVAIATGAGVTCAPSTLVTTAANQMIAIVAAGPNDFIAKLSS